MEIDQKYLKIIFWLLMAMVLVISSAPGSSVSQSILHLDKFVHIVAFFVLTIVLLFAYRFTKPFLSTAIIMAVFGLGIEVLHLYVPRRVFSMYDFAADLLGIAMALIAYRIIRSAYLAS